MVGLAVLMVAGGCGGEGTQGVSDAGADVGVMDVKTADADGPPADVEDAQAGDAGQEGDAVSDTGEAETGAEDTSVEGDGGNTGGDWSLGYAAPRRILPAEDKRVGTGDIYPVDLDGSGDRQLVVTEPLQKRVVWVHDCQADGCKATTISVGGLLAPVRARDVDFDGDGDRDVVIADVVSVGGQRRQGGRVVLLENDGSESFTMRTLLAGVGRVSWAAPGDADGDGDSDVIAGVFSGDKQGLHLLEQKADGTIEQRELSGLAGVVDAHYADVDGDGFGDVVAVFSQEVEKVVLFRNDGSANFAPTTIMEGTNACWGFNGLEDLDVDGDGDLDFLVFNGDAFDTPCRNRRSLGDHGIDLLKNDGLGGFTRTRIGKLKTVINAHAADLDGDGDLDVAATTQWPSPLFDFPAPPEAIWLENDGTQSFTRHVIEGAPPRGTAMNLADWNGDGLPDLLIGSMDFISRDDRGRRAAVMFAERRERE